MSKQIQQGTITFGNYKNIQDGLMPATAGFMVSGAEGPDLEFGGIVNAVDIDWNGALVPDGNSTDTLNTTGDLLSWVLNYTLAACQQVSDVIEQQYVKKGSTIDSSYIRSGSSGLNIGAQPSTNEGAQIFIPYPNNLAYDGKISITSNTDNTFKAVATEDYVNTQISTINTSLSNYVPFPQTSGRYGNPGQLLVSQGNGQVSYVANYAKAATGGVKLGDDNSYLQLRVPGGNVTHTYTLGGNSVTKTLATLEDSPLNQISEDTNNAVFVVGNLEIPYLGNNNPLRLRRNGGSEDIVTTNTLTRYVEYPRSGSAVNKGQPGQVLTPNGQGGLRWINLPTETSVPDFKYYYEDEGYGYTGSLENASIYLDNNTYLTVSKGGFGTIAMKSNCIDMSNEDLSYHIAIKDLSEFYADSIEIDTLNSRIGIDTDQQGISVTTNNNKTFRYNGYEVATKFDLPGLATSSKAGTIKIGDILDSSQNVTYEDTGVSGGHFMFGPEVSGIASFKLLRDSSGNAFTNIYKGEVHPTNISLPADVYAVWTEKQLKLIAHLYGTPTPTLATTSVAGNIKVNSVSNGTVTFSSEDISPEDRVPSIMINPAQPCPTGIPTKLFYSVRRDSSGKAFVGILTPAENIYTGIVDNTLYVYDNISQEEKFSIGVDEQPGYTRLTIDSNMGANSGHQYGGTIECYLPKVVLDAQNRKITQVNSNGVEESITFGNLKIVGVFTNSVITQYENTYRAGGHVGDNLVELNFPTYVGDLFLQKIDSTYHLFVCNKVTIVSPSNASITDNGTSFTAYFVDLGDFPGNLTVSQ